MSVPATYAALFDFDGVVADTEPQYSIFWHRVGTDYLGLPDLELRIKGQTLDNIFRTYFDGMTAEQADITAALDRYEAQMSYDYVPGVTDFVTELRRHGVHTAVVTSSNGKKMQAVYRARPELPTLFDRILTAEMFTASKPAPDCFLLGMNLFGAKPENTWVFEDSFNGLRAGMASGARVIGLATTNPRTDIAPLCHRVIDDFRGLTFESLTL